MLDRLRMAEARFEEVSQKITDPAVISDNERYKNLMKEYKNLDPLINKYMYKNLMKEYKNLDPLINKYREYKTAMSNMTQARELLDEGGLDPEMKELAQIEFHENKEAVETLEEELKILLLPKDPDDDRNVIVEIRGGAGGEEAALFANSLFRMYSLYAQANGWKTEIISSNPTELGGLKEIVFSIEGEGCYAKMKFESGVHRVQRVPETESQGRIHTSTITVAVLPEVEEVDVDINPADLEFQYFRASGAGGQHINKTDSAVRIIHHPTGVVVECQEERSQFKNKDKALKMLYSKLYEAKQREQTDKIAAERKIQVGTGDRSERIRTYNYPQGRVTDHRIGLTLYKLEDILNGDCDEVFEALALADRTARLLKAQG